MTIAKKILIADADKDEAAALNKALSLKGFNVAVVHDGTVALQHALSGGLDLIVLSINIPNIDGVRLSQILHSGSKTESLPIVFLSETDIQIAHFQRHKDSLFIKPINTDEVAARIYSYFDRIEKTMTVSKDKIIEGSLSEISLPDLLQMFHMSGKEGSLTLISRRENGEIFIQDGNILDARIGEITGEKALFRLLTWKSGNFKFVPSGIAAPRKITRPTDTLIMEGLRQYDEWESLKEKFPPMDSGLKVLIDPATLPKGLRPITQEILLLLEFYPMVSDIIDRSSFPDYEVVRTIMTLISKGIIGITKDKVRELKPILPKEDVLRLKERMSTHKKSKLETDTGKILIFSPDNERVKHVINALNTLSEFYIHKDFIKDLGPNPYIGTAGHIHISESILVNFVAAPVSDRFSPMWQPLTNSMLCGIAIVSGESYRWSDLRKIYTYFHDTLGKPLAFAVFEDEQPQPEEKKKEIMKQLDLKKNIMLFSILKNDVEGVRSMLTTLFHSVIGAS